MNIKLLKFIIAKHPGGVIYVHINFFVLRLSVKWQTTIHNVFKYNQSWKEVCSLFITDLLLEIIIKKYANKHIILRINHNTLDENNLEFTKYLFLKIL